MPPAAATEWERTGWTLEMIATDAPVCAAARAARWPARPAPMIRTSWDGTSSDSIYARCRPRPRPWTGRSPGPEGRPRASRLGAGGGAERGLQCPADLLDGDHTAQHALAVDCHQRTQPAQRLGPQ